VVFRPAAARFGLLICEDAWFDEPARPPGPPAPVLCVINASPFHLDKAASARPAWCSVRATGLPLLYAHLVGGQDEVVFDGASFAVDARGQVARAPCFDEHLVWVDWHADGRMTGTRRSRCPELEAQAWAALVTGRARLLGKNGFPGAIIGLSGGIDSALVLAIAVDALGADKVRCVMMPSPYTADISGSTRATWPSAWACATTRSRSCRCSTPSGRAGN
jgi:NAD+ synthase (glutamine-hydrolysing)